MGELLLCSRPMAALPYETEELSVPVYSLEELCYLMEHQIFLPEETFFEEDFFDWIEQERKDPELAEQLRGELKKGSGPEAFLELIFKAAGYLDKKTEQKLLEQVRQMQRRTVFERRKMSADRCLENKRYVDAIVAYRRILQMEEACRKHPVICGEIWHNQGTAFARLFLFEEAKKCFLKAYQMHMNIESVYAAMSACHFMEEEAEITRLAARYGVTEAEVSLLRETWEKTGAGEAETAFERQLDEVFEQEYEGLEQNPKLMQILQQWKMEYKKNCG